MVTNDKITMKVGKHIRAMVGMLCPVQKGHTIHNPRDRMISGKRYGNKVEIIAIENRRIAQDHTVIFGAKDDHTGSLAVPQSDNIPIFFSEIFQSK